MQQDMEQTITAMINTIMASEVGPILGIVLMIGLGMGALGILANRDSSGNIDHD